MLQRPRDLHRHEHRHQRRRPLQGGLGESFVEARDVDHPELEEADDAGDRASAGELPPAEDDQVSGELRQDQRVSGQAAQVSGRGKQLGFVDGG